MTGKTDPAGGQIVVGVDGTATSADAVRWAVRAARFRRASVHLIFVHDRDQLRPAPYAGRPGAPRPDEDSIGRTALLAAEQQAVQFLPPDRLSSELADGSVAKVLIDRSAGAELLVLGAAYPPGESGREAPPPMGPVARACLHSARCPVVVVGPHATHAARHRADSADARQRRVPRQPSRASVRLSRPLCAVLRVRRPLQGSQTASAQGAQCSLDGVSIWLPLRDGGGSAEAYEVLADAGRAARVSAVAEFGPELGGVAALAKRRTALRDRPSSWVTWAWLRLLARRRCTSDQQRPVTAVLAQRELIDGQHPGR
jgi:nucleotide-binding universal stress UspA family protein